MDLLRLLKVTFGNPNIKLYLFMLFIYISTVLRSFEKAFFVKSEQMKAYMSASNNGVCVYF